jgi:hypothetical protein
MTNTTRFDHTACDHRATPADRKACRVLRRSWIARLQTVYLQVDLEYTFDLMREYEAMVDLFAMRWGMELSAAYDLIERGPRVFN